MARRKRNGQFDEGVRIEHSRRHDEAAGLTGTCGHACAEFLAAGAFLEPVNRSLARFWVVAGFFSLSPSPILARLFIAFFFLFALDLKSEFKRGLKMFEYPTRKYSRDRFYKN